MQFFAFQTTLVKPLQPLNAPSPISVTELGMVTLVKPLQSRNALLPIEVTELGMVTLVKPEQPLNAPLPIEVTELGIIVFLHPLINVFVAVSIMALQFSRESYTELPLSTFMLVRPLQSENASVPILVTELPMVTLVKPLQ